MTSAPDEAVPSIPVAPPHALALLSRQHVLMTGPPGTAKSQMASLVLGRIIDESTGEGQPPSMV